MARFFDNSNDKIENADSSPVTAYPFTFGGWVLSASDPATSGNDPCIMQIQDDGASNEYWRLNYDDSGLVSSTGQFTFTTNDTGALGGATSTTIPVANTWYHVAGMGRNGSDREIWVNGVEEGDELVSRTPAGVDSVTIGREGDSSESDTWDGDLAEMFIYDVALSSDEMLALADGYSPLLVRPENLVAYWPLLGRSSPEPELIAGRNGTVTGALAADHPRIIYPPTFQYEYLAPPAGGGLEIELAMNSYRRRRVA